MLAANVALIGFLVGFPLGLLSALYRFQGRQFLLLFQVLPLLLPSFLLAIGWSNLIGFSWLPRFLIPTGFWGTSFILGMQAVPLVLLTTLAACHSLTAAQIDAARLHGGEPTVLRSSARACCPPATLAALLGGVLSLSDPGAALILGGRVIAVEILTSFSALFDFGLAARQCLVLAGLVVLIVLPLFFVGFRALAVAVLARQTRAPRPYPHPALGRLTGLGLAVVLAIGLGVPASGLCLPAMNEPMLGRAGHEMQRTLGETVIYAGGAGLIAVVLSTGLALAVANHARMRLVVAGVLLGLFALPPALGALGVVRIATIGPPELDWLTRSQFTVALVLGLRFLPIATLAMMRAVGSLSPSWSDAARLHAVSKPAFLCRVILPVLKPALLVGLLLVMVLATADITTVLLLHPPGRASLPVAVFTVMANSPEGLVASLCLMDLGVVILFLLGPALYPSLKSGRMR
ncbi:MAG: ABC transporter permease [Planctomycetaceae bacterium]